ncbi:MAG: helix-turn-helix transcriptional regulator [Planctomycetaceae bacterium]|nr:helix-turn-helix transcriptional regulator [Planctomycetaceae bacterium]
MTTQRAELNTSTVQDRSFELAISVLRERIRQLPNDDQADLLELLLAILGGDAEEPSSALATLQEILGSHFSRILPMDQSRLTSPELTAWMEDFGARLKSARREATLTQQELAQRSGIPQAHIRRLENRQHSPSAKTIERLAIALGKPVSFFESSAES